MTLAQLKLERPDLSPAVQISELSHRQNRYFVVRDDLLPGGTKQRAAGPLLRHLMSQGFDHFIYASPFSGFAQVALAYSCQIVGVRCTIFAECDPARPGRAHEYTDLAEHYGARVVLRPSLKDAEDAATTCTGTTVFKIPLGFRLPLFSTCLFQELKTQWQRVLKMIPGQSQVLWLPVGSGTLAQVFAKIVSPDVRLHCLNVHVLASHDARIQAVRENPRITMFSASQPFAEAATCLPRVPSNPYYDAKLWQLIIQHGTDGDVWWNVAR